MSSKKENIPVYSLNAFKKENNADRQQYQVEIFDANRHFKVSYPHRHDFYEILYLNNGSGIHIIDNNEYLIKPPCIFFLSPGQAHKLDLSQDIEGYIFIFTSEFYLFDQKDKNRLLEFPFFFSIEQQNPPLYIAKYDDKEFIEQLFFKGCKEISNFSNLSENIIRSLLDLLLLSCAQLYPHNSSLQQSKGSIMVKKFLALAEEHFKKNLKINDYAEILAVTPHHLTQVIKQLTGKTTGRILQEKQIIEIKRLLIHTDYSINEIVELLNFTDHSYFTKFFKKHTGLTPLEFKKNKQ